MDVLLLDHRDSFVFNLAEDLRRLGADCQVVRNDLELHELETFLASSAPPLVLLSPGPGRPEDHGALVPYLRSRPSRPLLGVCLGLQAMVVALGGRIRRSVDGPVHGRASRLVHDGDPLFDGFPSGSPVGRYHSLAVDRLPDELEAIAWTEDRRTVLAIRHRTLPWIGLQFHPESILTPGGRQLIANALRTLR